MFHATHLFITRVDMLLLISKEKCKKSLVHDKKFIDACCFVYNDLAARGRVANMLCNAAKIG